MRVLGESYRTIWFDAVEEAVAILDQTALPDALRVARISSLDGMCEAIRTMRVRGAPLIGVSAAFGLWLAMREDPTDEGLDAAVRALTATRPTAVNLRWAVDLAARAVRGALAEERPALARAFAEGLAEMDVETCRAIGARGAAALRERFAHKLEGTLEILTHCNAGWLATVDVGTALAPVYALHDAGYGVHVWVSETRPRDQGLLTEWELRQHGVPCTLLADNAAGHVLASGRVDACIVGSDRTTRRGDVCNKIGTYLKALAAAAHGVPFYVALPTSTIDLSLEDGAAIPIEERSQNELFGGSAEARGERHAWNPAFDVTPAKLVTALITERGVVPATESAITALFAR
ncbi:MAG: S-methyl-5-thioribose-1-phosphate isomerase [Polyangiaceae bacterium]